MARRQHLGRLSPTLLLRVSVILSGAAGFGVGLVLLWATTLGIAGALPFEALAQGHGQVQALGFTGLFILGTAAQLLPGFLAHPHRQRSRFVLGGLLLAFALLLRIIAQPLDNSIGRALTLVGFGILQGVAIGLCVFALADLVKRTLQPPELWRHVAMVSFGFLVVSAILNLVTGVLLAGGHQVIPEWLDSALITAELPGFAVFSASAVALKIFPRFLLLQPIRQDLVKAGVAGYLVGTIVTISVFLLTTAVTPVQAQVARAIGTRLGLAGIVLFTIGIGLYRRPLRKSAAPGVIEPARRWIRIAFGWLIASNTISALLVTRELFGGAPAAYLEITATRHALGQGFVLTLIVALGARILPGVSAWAIMHPILEELRIACLTISSVLRVGGQLASAAGTPSIVAAAVGGSLGTLGFLTFAVVVIGTVGVRSGEGSSPLVKD
jgi:hypothetical protein